MPAGRAAAAAADVDVRCCCMVGSELVVSGREPPLFVALLLVPPLLVAPTFVPPLLVVGGRTPPLFVVLARPPALVVCGRTPAAPAAVGSALVVSGRPLLVPCTKPPLFVVGGPPVFVPRVDATRTAPPPPAAAAGMPDAGVGRPTVALLLEVEGRGTLCCAAADAGSRAMPPAAAGRAPGAAAAETTPAAAGRGTAADAARGWAAADMATAAAGRAVEAAGAASTCGATRAAERRGSMVPFYHGAPRSARRRFQTLVAGWSNQRRASLCGATAGAGAAAAAVRVVAACGVRAAALWCEGSRSGCRLARLYGGMQPRSDTTSQNPTPLQPCPPASPCARVPFAPLSTQRAAPALVVRAGGAAEGIPQMQPLDCVTPPTPWALRRMPCSPRCPPRARPRRS